MKEIKKPGEPVDIKELLTHQLQLVSKESEDAHGDTLAALSNAAAYLAQVLELYCGKKVWHGFEPNPQFCTLTADEMPHHSFSL